MVVESGLVNLADTPVKKILQRAQTFNESSLYYRY